MNDDERFEEIENVLNKMSRMACTHIVLVEGMKDKRALVELGLISMTVIQVQKEGGPLVCAERVYETDKKAIILTDWDDRGNRIAKDLADQLSSLCIEYDTELRARLENVCKCDIKDIESLPTLYARLMPKNN